MALVASGFDLVVTLADSGGDRTTRTYDLRAGTAAQALTDAAVIIGRLILVSDAVISGYSLNQRFVEDALVLPVTNAEIENQLLLTMRVANAANKSGVIRIPAPKIGLFVNPTGEGRNQADMSDLDLNNYMEIFADDALAWFSDGEAATKQDARGRRVHAKSNRG